MFRASLSAAAESTKKVPLPSPFLRFYFTFGPGTAAFSPSSVLDYFRHFLAELGPLSSRLASVHAAAELLFELA